MQPRLNIDRLELTVTHTWRNWNTGTNDIAFLPTDTVGPGYPPQATIQVDQFYYAIVDQAYSLEELSPEFIDTHTELTWIPVTTAPVPLTANDPNHDEATFDLGPINDFDVNKVMIVRAESEAYISYENIGTQLVRSREMVQFPISNILTLS